MGEIFTLIFINPITNLLVVFYKIFEGAGFPYALGFAILGTTIFIRLVLYPFSAAQIKSAHKMQKVSPHIQAIREKHKDDKKRQQEEMMKLYKEHGVNPAGGCLPLLIQIPIFISIYNVLGTAVGADAKTVVEKINNVLYFPQLHLDKPWDTLFFGLDLSKKPSDIVGSAIIVAIAIPVITGLLQFVLSKMMIPVEAVQIDKKEKKDDNKKNEDFQSIMQTQTLYIVPAIIGFTSYSFPIGLSLYWNTFTLFGILQQYKMTGLGGMEQFIKKIKK